LAGKELKIGIVGLGFGQRVHLPIWKSLPGCEVVAVCSRHVDKASDVAAKHGIANAFADPDEMLSSVGLDAISVAVPPAQQPAILASAARKKVAVFMEKPLAADLASAKSSIEIIARSGVKTGVDFIFPELETWKKAKQMLNAGDIGGISHLAVTWRMETHAPRTGPVAWKRDPDEGGGALAAFASHSFYYMEWLFGRIRRLRAMVYPAHGSEDRVDALMEFDAGKTGSIALSTDTVGERRHIVEIYGDSGTLVLSNIGEDYVNGFTLTHVTRESKKATQISAEPRRYDDGRAAATESLIRRFADALRSGQKMVPDISDGLRVQQLMDATRRSAASGSVISVDET
jgi:predicted dehydrogenase